MSDALKEMLNPEFARLKVLLANREAELADSRAEIAALKRRQRYKSRRQNMPFRSIDRGTFRPNLRSAADYAD